jgi:hypothetical protein
LSLAIAASVVAGARAPTLAGDDKGAIAPVGSAVPARPRFEDAISPEERRRAAEVANPTGAFRPEGVWLPPLYLATADHSVEWVGLVYLSLTDFEAGTKTRVLPPFYLSRADADTRTVVTPLYGRREDLEGAAGYMGAYTWRRDRLADSDVVFPFFWSFRERDLEDGPDVRSSGAFAPFVFWQRDTSGKHRTISPPLFWRWGDANETTTILGNVYWHEEPGRKTRSVFPLYFGGSTGDDESYDVAPPLLFFRSTEGDRTTLLALNTIYASRPSGYTLASVPFVFAGRDGLDSYACVPPLLFFRAGDGTNESTLAANTFWSSGPDRWSFAFAPLVFAGAHGEDQHVFVPPLFWEWGDEKSSSWIAGPAFHHRDESGSNTGIFPLYLGGEHGAKSYDLFPPLLAGRVRDGDETTTLAFPWFWDYAGKDWRTTVAGPVFHHEEPGATDTGILPLALWGENGERSYELVPPLLAWHSSSKDRSDLVALPWLWSFERGAAKTTVLGPYYHHEEPGSSNTGIAPLWFSGEDETEKTRYDALPALLTWHSSSPDRSTFASLPLLTYHHEEEGVSRTLAANTYIRLSPEGWTFTFAPLVWAGGDAEESHCVGLPLLWYFTSPGHERLALLPFFDYAEDPERTRVVSALFFHHENHQDESSATVVLGLGWWLHEKQRDDRVIFPVWWDFEDRDAGTELETAFPLYWSWRRGADRTSVFLNTAWTSGETAKGNAWSFHVFPLADVSSDEPAHLHWQVLGGLFGHESRGDATRWRILWQWTDGG